MAGKDPGHRHVSRFEIVKVDAVVVVPEFVRLLAGNFLLDLFVLDDPSLLKVDEEDLARLEATEAFYVGRIDAEHPGFRTKRHETVLRLHPAARAQPVAIQRCTYDAAVGEADRGRTVPWLEQAGVEGVEALEGRREVGPVAVGLRDHHHRRVRQRAAGEHQELKDVVKGRRVGPSRAHNRHHLLKVGTEQLTGERALPRAHPVDVPHQRVDLAVVGDHAERMRELPAREGVGREARVNESQRRGKAFVAEIRVELRDLTRHQHALVDAGAGGEARRVEVGAG
uniref:Unannotated protein n=1 Tax=freshwater metagenome TaxID=449393 RepID=A0A6J5ZYZ3_9ZZZZ